MYFDFIICYELNTCKEMIFLAFILIKKSSLFAFSAYQKLFNNYLTLNDENVMILNTYQCLSMSTINQNQYNTQEKTTQQQEEYTVD